MDKPIEKIVGETDLRELLERLNKSKSDKIEGKLSIPDVKDNDQLLVEDMDRNPKVYFDLGVDYIHDALSKEEYEIIKNIFGSEHSYYKGIIKIKDKKVVAIDFEKFGALKNDIYYTYFDNFSRLKSIVFENKKLDTIPRGVLDVKYLENLEILSNNNSIIIADRLYGLRNLKRLSLINCYLRDIPVGIFKLKKLEKLSIEDNQIERIPEGILDLQNLKSLYLWKNNLGVYYIKDSKTRIILKKLKANGVKITFKKSDYVPPWLRIQNE